MIIYIKGSSTDIFKDSNIGTLSTWSIQRVLGGGATYSGVTYVDKNAAFSATVTIADGYELGSAGVTVTMGGVTQSGVASVSGNTVTISISSVTGNVVIKVPTVNTSTGEEDSGTTKTGSYFEDDATAIDLTSTATELSNIYRYEGDTITSSYFLTKQVDVSSYVGKMTDFTFVKYTSSTGAQPSYACGFLDSNGTFTLIKRVEISSLGAGLGEVELITNITIPSTAQYIVIPWFNETAVTNGNYSGSTSDFEIRVKDAKEVITEDISSEFIFTNGATIKPADGTEGTSTLFAASNYVDISGAISLTLSFMTWTSSSGAQAKYGLAFYDTSNTYISGYQFPLGSSGNSAGESYELTIDVPSNAQYIRTTYHQDTTTYGEFSASKSYYA